MAAVASKQVPVAVLMALMPCAQIARGQTAVTPTVSARYAVRLDPIDAVLDALGSYQLVLLGETHNEPRVHAFRLALIRHPKFPSLVDDIVLESGGSQFQEDMDRFVLGEPMPDTFLGRVLASAAPTFLDPMYEDIPRTVRELNGRLPPEHQIRIVLGEAPDHRERDAFVTEVIRREVLAKGRRALVIYGKGHVLRKHAVSVEEVEAERWMANRLERLGARLFSIWPTEGIDLSRLQRSVTSWRLPALAIVRGTPLGVADFAFYHSFGGWRLKDGQPILVNGSPTYDPPRPGLRMEEQVDAVLYLGR
jgi:hypothetical protein